ncbi:hypothetical protein OU426_03565 [Frigidibacter sp. RF13]|uniref:hypothetical protein n=1 Tax=Frigidibacter sp. RF13 TaxID=2997340 RepID=UPI00226EEFBF|nr:hypothetical protein [Frigidibacter sp. RF13]MCY1125922.1 hypothetical protein [Frigidibacter sp. RF13]
MKPILASFLAATIALAAPAGALTTKNVQCDNPGVGKAAGIWAKGQFAMFDHWAVAGDSLGARTLNVADCKAGRLLAASHPEEYQLDTATDVAFEVIRGGETDLGVVKHLLSQKGFTVAESEIAAGDCVCSDEILNEAAG